MSAADDIPEAWPLLLNKRQACAYLGMSEEVFSRICGVAPVDLGGVRLLRWNRLALDAWAATLRPRLGGEPNRTTSPILDTKACFPATHEEPAEVEFQAALARARQRSKWKKSLTSD